MTTPDKQALEALIVGALADLLALAPAQIDPNERFSHYGLTSLSAAELIARLSRLLARPLASTLVWDQPSARRMASFLCGEAPQAVLAGLHPMAADESIAIVGMACRVPGAAGPQAFWQLLLNGVEAVGEMPPDRIDAATLYHPDPDVPGRIATRRGGFLDQVDQFDAAFFGISPREAVEIDPQQRLVLELAYEALEWAAIAPSRLHGSRTGVFMGAMWSEYGLVAGGIEAIAQHSATGRDTGVIANRVSYQLGLTGPSMTVNTACSSSLVAVHLACQSLRSGESTLAIAGGVNLMISADGSVAMTKFGAMAPDGRSKAFDARANGYVRGEGAGLVLLKPLSRALADGDLILALVRGSAVNNDGPSNGLTAPSPDAQRAVLRDACASAGIAPADIDYVEAHGTGTMLGDPIEAAALGAVLGRARDADRPLLIGSAKTNLGHLEAAAGIAGMIKAVLALGQRIIPPSLNFDSPNPHIDFPNLNVRVADRITAWPRTSHAPSAGVSSFGFGGTNAHVVLEAWQGAPAAPPEPAAPPATRPLVFVYTGNGAQWAGMGQELLGTEPAFRAALQACDAAFRALDPTLGVLDELTAGAAQSRLVDTVVAQMMMFSVQVGLTALLAARGFAPQAVLGHSLGEVAAAYAAGALSLRDAARVVWSRSRLQASVAGDGAMAVVGLPMNSTQALLADYPALVVAGANAPSETTVAGPAEALSTWMAAVAERGIAAQRIRVDVAYHSPAMDRLCAPLAEALQGMAARDERVPFYSTVDASLVPGTLLESHYWTRNLRQPVRLAEAVAILPDAILVEISPQPILSRSLLACVEAAGRASTVLSTLARGEAAGACIDALVRQLAQHGVRPAPRAQERALHVLTLSAKDPLALQAMARSYAAALPGDSADDLADACYSANTGRDAFAFRLAAIAPDAGAMRALLVRLADGEAPRGTFRGEAQGGRQPTVTLEFGACAPRLVQLEQLAQWATPFADVMHSLSPFLRERCGLAWPAAGQLPALDPPCQRVLALGVGVGVATLLLAWGVPLRACRGAGVGALSAAVVNGELSLAEAVAAAADSGPVPALPLAAEWPDVSNAVAIGFGSSAQPGAALYFDDGDATGSVLGVLAALYARGVALDWQAFDRGMARRKIVLPTYPFQRRRFWPAHGAGGAAPALYELAWQDMVAPPPEWAAAPLLAAVAPPPAAGALPAALDKLAAAYAGRCTLRTTGSSAASRTGQRRMAALARLAQGAPGRDPDTLAAELLLAYPEAHIELALICKAGRNLQAVLDGELDAVELLFPDGSMEQLQSFYEVSPFALTLAGALRAAFQTAVAAMPAARVVEIGAGTGGTTAHLLPLLGAGGTYRFTDVSRAFLDRATSRFGAHPGFSSALLDIEAGAVSAHADAGSDIAVAVNVLHATADLAATLRAVRRQLRPGAILLLGEITGAPGWLDLVFGLLDGWWRFEDGARRAGSALLGATGWRTLLLENGFDDVAIAPDGDRQALIVARAGPALGRRLVLGSGPTAHALAAALRARGMTLDLCERAPAQGSWSYTYACDEDHQPAHVACDALASLFAQPRFGRLALVQQASPGSADPERATRQAACHAFALSTGAADPARWGGTFLIDDEGDGDGVERVAAMLARRIGEDFVRVTATGQGVARVQPLAPAPGAGMPVHPDRCYLIAGGLGTLGLAFAQWLFARGARNLALLGRSAPAAATALAIEALRSGGASVWVLSADLTDAQAMAQAFARLDAEAPPLAGVIHAAGNVRADAAGALAVKLEGARVLDLLARARAPQLFLLFSSAAGTWGAAGKAAYAAANAAQDALAAERRAAGLPGLSIGWGRFSVRGLLSEAEDALLAQMGMQAMTPFQAFDLAWTLTDGARASAVVAALDWPRFRQVCEARAARPLLANLPQVRTEALLASAAPAPVAVAAVAAAGAAGAGARGASNVLGTVCQAVAQVLGYDDPATLSLTQGLFDLGLDSLLAVRLRNRLEALFERPVPTALLFSHPTIGALAQWFDEPAGQAAATAAVPSQAVDASMAIAVIGVGCRFPGGVTDLDSFERLLFDGVNAVGLVPSQRWDWRDWNPETGDDGPPASNRWGGFLADVDQFDASFFGITPKDAAFMDPQQRLLLETAWQAIEHAGIAPPSLAGSAVGVYVGITGSDYAELARRDRVRGLEAQAISGQPANAAAGRIAFTLGLTGPALALDTACSSSLVAIHAACRALRAGECSSALAGGVNLIFAPQTSMILARAGMLSQSGQCRTFDADADGFVRAEGCAMVLLKPLDAALAAGDPVLAVVRGSAINHDGRASGFTVPNGLAQQAVLRAALADAGVSARSVAYVEAHGTGTALGDPIEAHALAAVFGGRAQSPLMVGSVKTNIGHAESAAGVAGFIKAVLALRRASIPPTLHFKRMNSHIAVDGALSVPVEVTPLPAIDGRRIAGVSAFGASGTNAHLVLEAAPAPAPAQAPGKPRSLAPLHLLTLSARHADSLRELAAAVAPRLTDGNLAALSHASARSRSMLQVRGFAVLESAGQAAEALAGMHIATASEQPRVAFLFTGQGAQCIDMGRALYEREPVYRAMLERCDALAMPLLGLSLIALMFDPKGAERLDQTCYAQPAMFALACATAALWREFGVQPDLVLGHSVGEFAAAVSAGMLTHEAAMALVVARGRLMQALPAGGHMLAVSAPIESLLPMLAAEPALSLACENGPADSVLSGPDDALDRIAGRLARLEIRSQRLAGSHAFHSALLEPMLGALEQAGAGLDYAPAQLPFISTLTGAVRPALDAAYWARHAREPVRFAQALRCAREQGATVFIEIGPQAVLSSLAGRTLADPAVVLIPSMRRGVDASRAMLEAVAQAWQAGVDVVLPALRVAPAGSPAALPLTPFRRVRHWLDWVDAGRADTSAPARRSDLVYELAWEAAEPTRGAVPGVWQLRGDSDSAAAAALAGACRALGFDLRAGQQPPPGGWHAVLWLAPSASDVGQLARACAALQELVEQSPVPVWLVTRAAQTRDQGGVDYHASALWGMGRALALQGRAGWGGMLDLPLLADSGRDARALAGFLCAPLAEDQVLLRDGAAYVARLVRASTPGPLHGLRGDRCYLVTGAFGALGRTLVDYLLAAGVRHIALVARRVPDQLPAAWCADGLQIVAFSADVGCADAMAQVARQLEATLPPVAGIFHVAGLKTQDLGQSLQPKLRGAEVLHEVARHWPLELFVLFSSAAAVWGDPSLAAYAAANAALDGFAHWRRSQGLPALSINWGPFATGGMLDDEGAAHFERLGLHALPANAAFNAMRALLAAGHAQATVASVAWDIFAAVHRGRRARPLLAQLAPLAAQAPAAAPLARADVAARLQIMLADILGLGDPAAIDTARGFFALGLDSFGVLDLRRRIERELGCVLAPSALFDAPNVGALAEAIAPAAPAAVAPAAPGAYPPAGRDPIAIVGTALRLPGAVRDLDGLERLLFDGVSAVDDVPAERSADWNKVAQAYRRAGFLDDIASFDADFFGISPREACQMDPQHRMLLELAWQAVEHAGWSVPSMGGSRTGVFIGITGTEYADIARASGKPDAHAVGGQFLNAAAGRLSHALGLTGPSLAVDTACSSSAMALHLACNALWAGQCDSALAGGANLLLAPETSAMLVQARMLSAQSRCASFDDAADGYVRAEGCALVVLKPLARALADGDRVLATIRASAANHDGASGGFTVPNGSAQRAVIRAALEGAELAPGDISYVEAHGTGTPLGDPVEMHALDAVFGDGRDHPLLVGSIKSNIGHAEAAAGIAGLLKLVVALRRRRIPAHLHFRRLNRHIEVAPARVAVASEATRWEPLNGRRIAGMSAFGASGTNVHLIIEEAPAVESARGQDAGWLLALSARRPDDLAALAAQVLAAPDPQRACREASLVRSDLPYRVLAQGADLGELRSQLTEQMARGSPARAGSPRVAFMFTGQGAQYAGMAHGLYRSEPVFKAAIDACEQAMAAHLPVPLTTLLFDSGPELVATGEVQPALFAVGYALAQLWVSFGVQPVALIGHSVGEIAAACIGGVLALDAAAELVCVRGRLMGALPAGGAMAAVWAGAGALQPYLDASAGAVVVAALNGPASTVLSGEAHALGRILQALDGAGIRTHRLNVSHAFHSALLDPMLDQLEQCAARLPMASAQLPLASNIDGAIRRDFDARYWRAQARSPVAFAAGMASLQALGCDTFIEIGPQPVLCGMGRECIGGALWIPSLRQGSDDVATLRHAAATLWQAGASIDWRRVLGSPPKATAPLPSYPFRRSAHWLAPRAPLFADWIESPAFNGRMHSLQLGRSGLAALDDSAGLVHVGLHMAFLSSACADAAAGCTVSSARFPSPLVLTRARQLQLLVAADGSASLHAREADGSWTCHMQASFDAAGGAPGERIDPLALQAACATLIGPEAWYGALRAKGFELGPGLRLITQLWLGDGQVLAQAHCDATAGQLLAFGLPAALFEICAQVPAAFCMAHERGYMLLGWERMTRTTLDPSAQVWIHALTTLAADGVTLHADIALHASCGGLLARIDGALLRPGGSPRARAGGAWAGRVEWLPAAVGALPQQITASWRLLGTDAATHELATHWRASRPDLFTPDGTCLALLVSGAVNDQAAALEQVSAHAAGLTGGQRLLLLTRDCQDGAADAGAGVWGLAQAIRAERPDVHCRCVDASGADALAVVASEMADSGAETSVAWKGNARTAARLRALPALPAPPVSPAQCTRLVVAEAGALAGLAWRDSALPAPADDEVVIEVVAAAAGLRDALLTYGVLDGGALGSDCAGIVMAVGSGVRAFVPGDAVIAYAPHAVTALGTHVVLAVALVRPKPPLMGFAAAATLPMPYLVAWHGLVELGALKAGQTLLVHCAGSATGLAAVAIARAIGARVVATAGRSKHAALAALGIDVRADSRGPGLDGIEGVDVAFGAFDAPMRAALDACLAPHARVIDLTRVGHDGGVNLDRLVEQQPEQFGALFDRVCAELASGRLQPLLHEVVQRAGLHDALRRLSQGSVIGRQVVWMRATAPPPDTTWLLSGANGAIGRLLTRHLVERGVTHLVLLDRTPFDSAALDALGARGIAVLAAVLDVTDPQAVAAVLQQAQREMPPVRAIVHAAGVVSDAPLAGLRSAHFDDTYLPKVDGARVLDMLSRDLPIEHFVVFSSAVAHLPSARQGAYAAANAALEQIARRRRALGLAAIAMAWGPWDAGIGITLGSRARAAWRAWGVEPLRTSDALAWFDRLLSRQADAIVIDVDWERYCLQGGRVAPLLGLLVAAPALPVPAAGVPLPAPAPAAPSSAQQVALWVAQACAGALRVADPARIDMLRPFHEQGMDSLMATELAEELGRRLGRRLPGTLIYNYPTPALLAAYLSAGMEAAAVSAPAAAPAAAPPAGRAQRLAASLARTDQLLGKPL